MEGQMLGNRYELIERIGGGGMAVVYKAKCHLLNRYVAVKILRSEFTDDEEFVKRFRVEAQAAASLSHPNIVSIFDVGQEGNIHYIVMEFINGITLKEYISQKGVLPWREAVNIAAQICSALETAHRNHIIHRDIKPHNIMITKEGIAKVTDFGIARAVSSATITMVGSTIGSVHYFSPEQARGSITDEKSDLYSLGITIYEMVTGQVPFDGETPVAVALKHIQEKPEKPCDINPSIPKGVNDLIMKSIKKDQNLRYQSASEMLSDLQRTLGEPNTKINGSTVLEELPTRKMKVVNADIEIKDEDENEPEEGEEDMTAKHKKDRLSVWLGIATGLIIVGIIFFIGWKFVIPAIIPDDQGGYVVLDYANKNFNEVREELMQYDIKAVDSERVYSDTVEQDIIISQEIAAGNKLKPGSSINFKVSNGIELVEIPDITNEEQRAGEQIIKNQELEPKVVEENNDKVPTGYVIRTEPAALEKVRPNDTVTVFVSLGPKLEKVIVPSIIGLTRADAEKLVTEKKLSVGTILPAGVISETAKIVKQYPLAETKVDEGTPVEMTFGIDDGTGQTTPGDGTGQTTTGTPADGTQTPASGGEQRIYLLPVTLDPNHTYGEEIMVYVEATPSDTNVTNTVMNQKVAKSTFNTPLSVPVPLAKSGSTHVIVKLDGILVLEDDIK
ncbi:MAG: Stk1 family PASTA domain-containing Ser/Thr kinase [Clostridiaceae bacterium]